MRLSRRLVIDYVFLGFMAFVFTLSFVMLAYNWVYLSSNFTVNLEYAILILVSLFGFHLWRRER